MNNSKNIIKHSPKLSDIASIPGGMPPETILPNELSDGVYSDPGMIEAYVQDPMVPKEITSSIFIELTKVTDSLKINAANLVEPILILHEQNDALVAEKDSPSPNQAFLSNLVRRDFTISYYNSHTKK